MSAHPTRRTTVLVIAESAADANLVMESVSLDPVLCRACIEGEDLMAVTDADPPDVLVFAHRSLSSFKDRLHQLFAGARAELRFRYRVLALCHKDELRAAFDACRDNLADDYVQFWPMPHDGYRLRLALRSLQQRLQLQHQIQAAADALNKAARYPAPEPQAATLPPAMMAALTPPPLAAAAPPAVVDTAPPPRAVESASDAIRARVLLVDDDPFQYKLTRMVLGSLPLELLWASSGSQALELARQGRPDLILMDINMPDLDGIETVRGMRTQAHLKEVPIIMLTGNSERTRVVQSLTAGASGFIVKPFTKKMLHDLIAKHLKQVTLT